MKRHFLLSKFLNIEPTALQNTGLNPVKRHDLWNKYAAYILLQYQNQQYYSKPEDELISIVCEKKNTRAVNAKKAKKKPAKDLNKNKNLVSNLPELQTAGPAK